MDRPLMANVQLDAIAWATMRMGPVQSATATRAHLLALHWQRSDEGAPQVPRVAKCCPREGMYLHANTPFAAYLGGVSPADAKPPICYATSTSAHVSTVEARCPSPCGIHYLLQNPAVFARSYASHKRLGLQDNQDPLVARGHCVSPTGWQLAIGTVKTQLRRGEARCWQLCWLEQKLKQGLPGLVGSAGTAGAARARV